MDPAHGSIGCVGGGGGGEGIAPSWHAKIDRDDGNY